MLRMLLAKTHTTATTLLLAASRRSMPCKAVGTQTAGHSYSSTSASTWQSSPPGRPKIIIITGPTAVGKTKLGLELAKRLDGEIISADSVQVYKGLDIGSDKLPVVERQGIPHHLIDILPPDAEFSAGDFYHLGRRAAEDIISRGRVPIVVGGTGFYLRWFIFGKAQTPPSNPQTAQQVQHLIQQAWAAAAAAATGGEDVCEATAGQADGLQQQQQPKQQQNDVLGQVEQQQLQAENGLKPDRQQQEQQGQQEVQEQQPAVQQQLQGRESCESDWQQQQRHLTSKQQDQVAGTDLGQTHYHHQHQLQQQQQQQIPLTQASNTQQQQQQHPALEQQDQSLITAPGPAANHHKHHCHQQQQQQQGHTPISREANSAGLAGSPHTAPAAAAAGLSEDQQWHVAVDLVAQLGDPEAAERIRAERNNWYRLQRVMQILLQNGGKPLSELDVKITKPLDYDFRCFFLYRNRIELYDRICYRVEEMVLSGLLEEALMLLDMGLTPNSHIATKAIGYRQACEFMQKALIEGQATKQQLQQLILDIATASRNLVKSQTTWFRDDQLFRWLEVGGRDAEDVLQDLLNGLDRHQHEGGCGDSGRLDKELQKALKRYVPVLRIFSDDAKCAEVLQWVSQAVTSVRATPLE